MILEGTVLVELSAKTLLGIADSAIKTLIVVTVDDNSFTVVAEGDTRPLTAKLMALFKRPMSFEIKRQYASKLPGR